MFIKLIEVFHETNHSAKSFDVLRKYHLREIVVNSEYIVAMREDTSLEYYLEKNQLPEGLDKQQKFTMLTIMRGQMGMDVAVVGSLESVFKIVGHDKKGLLKG